MASLERRLLEWARLGSWRCPHSGCGQSQAWPGNALCADQHAISGPDWQPSLSTPYCPKTGQALSSPGRNQTHDLQE